MTIHSWLFLIPSDGLVISEGIWPPFLTTGLIRAQQCLQCFDSLDVHLCLSHLGWQCVRHREPRPPLPGNRVLAAPSPPIAMTRGSARSRARSSRCMWRRGDGARARARSQGGRSGSCPGGASVEAIPECPPPRVRSCCPLLLPRPPPPSFLSDCNGGRRRSGSGEPEERDRKLAEDGACERRCVVSVWEKESGRVCRGEGWRRVGSLRTVAGWPAGRVCEGEGGRRGPPGFAGRGILRKSKVGPTEDAGEHGTEENYRQDNLPRTGDRPHRGNSSKQAGPKTRIILPLPNSLSS